MQGYRIVLTRMLFFVVFCMPIQEFGQDTMFDIYKQRLEFLTRNDAVIAQNIANADTPKYKPKELKEKKQIEIA